MHEITGSHVQRLDDSNARILIAMLCAAELRRFELALSSLTAGGNQNANDGGIDVHVSASKSWDFDFVPRQLAGFQVKAEKMPARAVTTEMRPKGNLRPSIVELIEHGGAYVIASTQDSLTHTSLRAREQAMHAAIAGVPNAGTAFLAFYDSDRIATWTNEYPGVAMWLREKIGEPRTGWFGYESWSADTTAGVFKSDTEIRLVNRTGGAADSVTVADGIAAMRATLNEPSKVVRLVGLSGTGKTRFVQALFDVRIGIDALPTSVVLYTDQGLTPNPSARDMVSALCANKTRAIVVVDNCNPALHRDLSRLITNSPTKVSLITVEYDVGDDEYEEADAFELLPASHQVLSSLLTDFAPWANQNDIARIVDFSGGNAQIGLALARTLKRGKSLGVLNDRELFKRLFHQGHAESIELLVAAQALSLVYSFDGTNAESPSSELATLGKIVGIPGIKLFRSIALLKRRGLLQRRNKWRAVLPHALANRLATQALEETPIETLVETLNEQPRLLRSFTRRLTYLDNSEQAVQIAEKLVQSDDWLAHPEKLNELGIAMFQNIAPLVPELALSAIERMLERVDSAQLAPTWNSRFRWISLTRHLGYEPETFERAAKVLLRIISGNTADRSVLESWKGMFQLWLSGTEATPEQRVKFIRELVNGTAGAERELGILAIESMLKAVHFTSNHDFKFGARSRDFGWKPRIQAELTNWYALAFGLVLELHAASSTDASRARAMVAQNFRQLWMYADSDSNLLAVMEQLAGPNGWAEGWSAVRLTLKYDRKRISPERASSLESLRPVLHPDTFNGRLEAYVLSQIHGPLDIASVDDDSPTDEASGESPYARAQSIAEDLGAEAAGKPDVFTAILPLLLRVNGGRQEDFGRGVARGSKDLATTWSSIRAAFGGMQADERFADLLVGFLRGAQVRATDFTAKTLDASVTDPYLADVFPLLQGSFVTPESAARLLASLEVAKAPTSSYSRWSHFVLPAAMPTTKVFCRVVDKISKRTDGFIVALDMLSRALEEHREMKTVPDRNLRELGQTLLEAFDFETQRLNLDYYVNRIAETSLSGPDGAESARKFCSAFARALLDYRSGASSLEKVARTVFSLQPSAAMDAFLTLPDNSPGHQLLRRFSYRDKSVLESADPQAVMEWVSKNPEVRVLLVAVNVEVFSVDVSGDVGWAPIAKNLVMATRKKAELLQQFEKNFWPYLWSESAAATLASHKMFVRKIKDDSDPQVATWAREMERKIEDRIRNDNRIFARQDEAFEYD